MKIHDVHLGIDLTRKGAYLSHQKIISNGDKPGQSWKSDESDAFYKAVDDSLVELKKALMKITGMVPGDSFVYKFPDLISKDFRVTKVLVRTDLIKLRRDLEKVRATLSTKKWKVVVILDGKMELKSIPMKAVGCFKKAMAALDGLIELYREFTDEEVAEAKAAKEKAVEKKTAADKKIADKKAADEKKVADKKAAADKKVADKKAADEKKASDKKAADDKAAADDKTAADKKASSGKVDGPIDLSGMKVDELKALAKTKGIKGYSSMKRDTLVKALT